MGDLLFAIANLARKLGIEPETALRKANDKFTRRFTAMESSRSRASGRAMKEMTLEQNSSRSGRVKRRSIRTATKTRRTRRLSLT